MMWLGTCETVQVCYDYINDISLVNKRLLPKYGSLPFSTESHVKM